MIFTTSADISDGVPSIDLILYRGSLSVFLVTLLTENTIIVANTMDPKVKLTLICGTLSSLFDTFQYSVGPLGTNEV